MYLSFISCKHGQDSLLRKMGAFVLDYLLFVTRVEVLLFFEIECNSFESVQHIDLLHSYLEIRLAIM